MTANVGRRPLVVGAYYLHEMAARALVNGLDPAPALDETFDLVRRSGAFAVRTWAMHVGTGPTAIQSGATDVRELGLRALDWVLGRAARAGVRLVLALGNAWDDYGGARAVTALAGHGEARSTDVRFYVSPRAWAAYVFGVRAVLSRTSHLDGHLLATHPAVIGWEPLNEPRARGLDRGGRALERWLGRACGEIAAAVRSPTLMISTGEEGLDGSTEGRDVRFWRECRALHLFRHGQSFRRNTAIAAVTHGSVHVYPQAWGVPETKVGEAGVRFIRESAALASGKPLFVGEMGAIGEHALEHLARWARATWEVGGVAGVWMLASPHMPRHRDRYAIEPEVFVDWAKRVRLT